MTSDHPAFQAPPDPDVRLWRYMDLAKFVALLSDGALFFVWVNKLGDDPFEGAWTKPAVEAVTKTMPSGAELAVAKFVNDMRRIHSASSWHMNDHESAAMWGLYGKSSDSICMQTTFRLFSNSLPAEAHVGVVEYKDYDVDQTEISNSYYPLLSKRHSYDYEREVRAIIAGLDPLGNVVLPSRFQVSEHGVKVPVKLDCLIERVLVNPISSPWFKEVVESIAARYDLNVPICTSSLAERPLV